MKPAGKLRTPVWGLFLLAACGGGGSGVNAPGNVAPPATALPATPPPYEQTVEYRNSATSTIKAASAWNKG